MTLPNKLGRGQRRALRVIGWAIVAVTLYYFTVAVARHWSQIAAWSPGWQAWAIVFAAIFFYATALLLLAELWHGLVQGTQDQTFSRALTFSTYSKTQIAKYLPGNVFQYLSRHIVMADHGASQGGLALANILEICTLILVAGLFALIGFTFGAAPHALELSEVIPIHWLVPTAMVIAIFLIIRITRKLRTLPNTPSRQRLIYGLLLASIFFLAMGFTLLVLVGLVSGDYDPAIIVIAVTSWLLGYVTPGAHGGIGIREFVLLIFLQAHIPEAEALIAIGLFRVFTSLGDLAFFIGGAFLWRISPRVE